MAQPKRGRKDQDPKRQELDNLEKRMEHYIQKRNELNDQARLAREERNLLNDKKNEIFEKMNVLKEERDKFNEELKKHKEARNAYQAEAKHLIAKKRGVRKKGEEMRSAPMRARELESEIRDMAYKQETTAMPTKDEEKLVKAIRQKKKELDALKPELEKAKQFKFDISDTDKAIDELFAKADEEHAKVVACYKASNEKHQEYVSWVKQIKDIAPQSDSKHQEFIDLKTRADEQHQKVLELRSKILEIKGASRQERDEARKMIKEHAKRAREAVADPKKLEEHHDKALDELKKGGKIQIG